MQSCMQALQWRRCDIEYAVRDFLLFTRKVLFGAKMRREETQERATDVGPVKKKEKRKREREREREGRRDQKSVCTHVRTFSWSVPMDWERVDAARSGG